MEEATRIISAMDLCVDTFFPQDYQTKRARLQQLGGQLESLSTQFSDDPRLSHRAMRELCAGRILDIDDCFCAEAHDHFETAVKLDPHNVDAWNALAESFWKNKDYTMAETCFRGALKVRQNKVALRRLSMILRIILNNNRGTNNTQMISGLENSLKLAKEAVTLDVQDGVSWYVLGNAFMGMYFGRQAEQDPSDLLRQAIRAYNQAESLLGDTQIPDLHHNRANVHAYLQEYGKALTDLLTAHKLDTSLGALRRYSSLIAFLKNCEAILDVKRYERKMNSFLQKLVGVTGCDPFGSLTVGANPNSKVCACVLSSTQDFDGLGIIYLVVDQIGNLHLLFVGKVCNSVRAGCVIVAAKPFLTSVEIPATNSAQLRTSLQFVCIYDPCANITVDSKPIQESDLLLTEVLISQPERTDNMEG